MSLNNSLAFSIKRFSIIFCNQWKSAWIQYLWIQKVSYVSRTTLGLITWQVEHNHKNTGKKKKKLFKHKKRKDSVLHELPFPSYSFVCVINTARNENYWLCYFSSSVKISHLEKCFRDKGHQLNHLKWGRKLRLW